MFMVTEMEMLQPIAEGRAYLKTTIQSRKRKSRNLDALEYIRVLLTRSFVAARALAGCVWRGVRLGSESFSGGGVGNLEIWLEIWN